MVITECGLITAVWWRSPSGVTWDQKDEEPEAESILSFKCTNEVKICLFFVIIIVIIIIVYFRHKVHRNYNKTAQRTDRKHTEIYTKRPIKHGE